MDVYVAPTIINLENPTFWISNLGQVNLFSSNDQTNSSFKDKDIRGGPASDRDSHTR